MRDADRKSGRTGVFVRPRFGIWENVVGALSSGRDPATGQKRPGADFQKVLEAFIQIEEPHLHVVRPEAGRWEYSGAVLGVRSCVAWITWDAQYFGVPQRRRRIFAVADFAGYTIDAPDGPEFGTPTSIEVVHTADGGAMKNEDVSKNAALIPPGFGTPSMDAMNTGTYLTPNLAPGGMPATGTVIGGSGSPVVEPGSTVVTYPSSTVITTGYTEVTSDLYYSAGYLGTLKIPALNLSVKVYQGTDSKTLAKGVGHFEETSIWNGNVALAAHNRGVNNYFGQIHTLEIGDKITLTTKLGTRTYKVTNVSKVSETDRSGLAASSENMLTLYTCVRNQRDARWCVTAVEV